MAELPEFIALKSVMNQKYLVFKDQSTTELPHILQCSGEDAKDPQARFKVEKDANLPHLVHIKSISKNKYWSKVNQGSSWIVAGADHKRPEKNIWSSTLFQPQVLQPPLPHLNLNGVYQFRHEQMGTLIEPIAGNEFVNALAAENANPTHNTAFIVEKLPG